MMKIPTKRESIEMYKRAKKSKVKYFLGSWGLCLLGYVTFITAHRQDYMPFKSFRIGMDHISGSILGGLSFISGIFFGFCLLTKTWENYCDKCINKLQDQLLSENYDV